MLGYAQPTTPAPSPALFWTSIAVFSLPVTALLVVAVEYVSTREAYRIENLTVVAVLCVLPSVVLGVAQYVAVFGRTRRHLWTALGITSAIGAAGWLGLLVLSVAMRDGPVPLNIWAGNVSLAWASTICAVNAAVLWRSGRAGRHGLPGD